MGCTEKKGYFLISTSKIYDDRLKRIIPQNSLLITLTTEKVSENELSEFCDIRRNMVVLVTIMSSTKVKKLSEENENVVTVIFGSYSCKEIN